MASFGCHTAVSCRAGPPHSKTLVGMRAVTVRKLIDRARSRLPKQLRREPANNIGAYFAQGEEGLPKSLRKALYWYTLGAIDGDFVAQCNLALMHYYGEGDVERNRWLAYKWFIPA